MASLSVYAQSQRGGIERICPKIARNILDIGGSSGVFAAFIKEKLSADRVYLADRSQDALDQARDRVDGVFLVDLDKRGDLTQSIKDIKDIDLVFCLCVLEHTYDPWKVVEEIHHILAPGGMLIASLPNTQHLRFVFRALMGRWHYNDIGLFDRTHIRFFSFASAKRLLAASGLQIVATQPRITNAKLAVLNRLTLGIFQRFLALQIEIAVRKVDDAVKDTGFCGSNVVGA